MPRLGTWQQQVMAQMLSPQGAVDPVRQLQGDQRRWASGYAGSFVHLRWYLREAGYNVVCNIVNMQPRFYAR